MDENQIDELNLLRILSCLIVVALIHIPNNYAYNYYIELSALTGLRMHTFGIHSAMGSFTFISGFILSMKMNTQGERPVESSRNFLLGRLKRIFPLYWIALIIFLFLFDYIYALSPWYIAAHFFGMQMIKIPLIENPVWTLWYIGIIIPYYLAFLLFRRLRSLKYIIPAAFGILATLVTLNYYFGLFEARLILYYLLFIIGIVSGKLFVSPFMIKIRNQTSIKSKIIKIMVAVVITALGIIGYLKLTLYFYNEYDIQSSPFYFYSLLNYFGPFLSENWLLYPLVDLTIICFIGSFVSTSYLILKLTKLIFKEKRINRVISTIAYSTYCVYLFHRPLIILISTVFTQLFGLNMYAPNNLWVALLVIVPLVFIISFGIQMGYDSLLRWFKVLITKSKERRVEKEEMVEKI